MILNKDIDFDEELITQTTSLVDVESQVIVHISLWADQPMSIRIWGSTFLFTHERNHHSKLVHFENISLAPSWTAVHSAKPYRFTLIFEGLPKSCTQFDLIELANGPGCFEFKNISRNQTDIYYLETSSSI
ncbi:MAG: hypothetical protein ACKOX3_09100 [Bacteroidota bacterium]